MVSAPRGRFRAIPLGSKTGAQGRPKLEPKTEALPNRRFSNFTSKRDPRLGPTFASKSLGEGVQNLTHFGTRFCHFLGARFGTTLGSILNHFGVARRGRGRAAGAAEDHCSSQHSFETISLQPSIFKRASRSLAKTGFLLAPLAQNDNLKSSIIRYCSPNNACV